MTSCVRILAVLLLLSPSLSAQADEFHAGADASFLRLEDAVGETIQPTNLGARVGYEFTDYFGVEALAQFTLLDDSVSGVDFSTEIFGIHFKLGAPVSDSVELFVLGGASNVQVNAEVGDIAFEGPDESGPSFGLGGDQALSSNRALTLRYMRHLEEDGLFSKVTGLTIGHSWMF